MGMPDNLRLEHRKREPEKDSRSKDVDIVQGRLHGCYISF